MDHSLLPLRQTRYNVLASYKFGAARCPESQVLHSYIHVALQDLTLHHSNKLPIIN